MNPQTIDVHAHILTEDTIRLLQRESPKAAPKLSDVDEQFGTLDVAGNVYRHFPRGGWDLDRRFQDMTASKVDMQVLSARRPFCTRSRRPWRRRSPASRTSSSPSW
jgi:aminocarboxymuconate-semialdehyde decarboxylase